MPTNSDYELIARILCQEASEEDRVSFESKLKIDADFKALYTESQKIWDNAVQKEEAVDVDEAWDRLAIKLNTSSKKSFHLPSFWYLAASFLLVFGLSYYIQSTYFNQNEVFVYTAENEIKEISLPDGSIITLNRNSSISYPEKWAEQRTVKLRGEAFFDVKRDEKRPFIIQSQYSITEVLGTSFSIKNDSIHELVALHVASGKVKFTAINTSKSLLVEANEAAYITDKGTQVNRANPDVNAFAWKNRRLIFNDASLPEVISSIESYFNVKIELVDKEILACRLTADFQEPSINKVLDTIIKVLDVKVKKQNNIIYLSGKGCKI